MPVDNLLMARQFNLAFSVTVMRWISEMMPQFLSNSAILLLLGGCSLGLSVLMVGVAVVCRWKVRRMATKHNTTPYVSDKHESKEQGLTIFPELLGEGYFGEVRKGLFVKDMSSPAIDVAVKQLKASAKDRKTLLMEIEALKIVDHPNIIKFFGAVRTGRDSSIVLEFCEHGSLWSYLLEAKHLSIASSSSGSNSCSDFPVSHCQAASSKMLVYRKDLFRWSHEIAVAMEYLGTLRIIHRDLAARNVLLDHNLQVKVSDFGLSRALQPRTSSWGWYCYYRATKDRAMPYPWMSIEALLEHVYTVESDVWAFGVTLWEIFSSCQSMPYAGKSKNSLLNSLIAGGRLEKPTFATDRMYDIMSSCWFEDPKSRPSFTVLTEQILSVGWVQL